MALINCPECGKEISDTCESCIHCGYKLSNNASSKDKKANKKKVSIIAILLVIVIIIGISIASILIINSIRENNRIEQEKQEQLQEQLLAQEEAERQRQAEIEAKKLTYEEEMCYYAIQYFKTILRDPDSLQINKVKISPSFIVYYDDKDSEGHYSEYIVYLDYSAQNGFGGSNREDYYIPIKGKKVTENISLQQEQLQNDYIDRYSIYVKIDKIKYALDHPEVLDY